MVEMQQKPIAFPCREMRGPMMSALSPFVIEKNLLIFDVPVNTQHSIKQIKNKVSDMNRVKQSVLMLAVLSLMVWGPTANAQNNPGDITLGAGLSYGEKFSELGLQLGGYYVLNEDMRIGGDFVYWFIDSPSGFSNTYFELNGNFHYLFYQENDITLYGIGSLGIHRASFEFTFFGETVSESDTDLGLGIGAGGEYDLGAIKLYVEPRLFLTGFDQFGISFGVRYTL